MVTIDNGVLRVRIAPMGAELQSIYAPRTDREYLWQGDPAIWSGRSPLLFPIVGRLKDDAYVHAGKRYTLEKHGFARHAVFEVAEASGTEAVFLLEAQAGERAEYPFAYRLTVRYALQGDTLAVTHAVENTGQAPMYFSIGAHPGFCCAMGDMLIFEREEPLRPYRLTGEMLLSQAPEASYGEGVLEITPELFEEDALIFRDLASRSVQLVRQDGERGVTVRYGDAPCLGIWAKPGAPYVCIEPWYGADDHAGVSGVLSEKPYIQVLTPGGRFEFPVLITMDGVQGEEAK